MQDSLSTKTAKGVSWSFLDSLVGQGLTFVVGIVLARILSPREFGFIGIVTVFISIFDTIADSGINKALIRKNDVDDIDFNTAFYFNVVVSILMYLALCIIAPYAALFFGMPEITPLLRVMGVIIIICSLTAIQRSILTIQIDFKKQAYASIISSVVSGALGIYLALSGHGVWSLAWQMISRNLFYCIMLWAFGTWFPKLIFSTKRFLPLFSFGYKLLLASLLDTVWREIYQITIGKIYNAETLGLYTRGKQFSDIFSCNITTVIQKVTYPILGKIQDDTVRLVLVFRKLLRTVTLITSSCLFTLIAVAEPLVLIILGEKWIETVPLLQLTSIAAVFLPLHILNLNLIQIKGRSDIILKLEIIKKVVGTIPIVVGILTNIYWMLFSSILTTIVSHILNAGGVSRITGYTIIKQTRDFLTSVVLGLALLIVCYPVSYLAINSYYTISLQVIFGLFVFVVLCKTLYRKEIEEIINILKKLSKARSQ